MLDIRGAGAQLSLVVGGTMFWNGVVGSVLARLCFVGLVLAGAGVGPGRAAEVGEGCPADLKAGPERDLAYRAVSGAVGPFGAARVTLIGNDANLGPFTGWVDIGRGVGRGRCLVLQGPEDITPTVKFDFFVRAVLLMRVERGEGNAVVVLYDTFPRRAVGSNELVRDALLYRVREKGRCGGFWGRLGAGDEGL